MSRYPAVFDFHLYRGDGYGWRFQTWDKDEFGQPTIVVPLDNVAVAAEIRDKRRGSVIVPLDIEVTLPNSIDVRIGATQWLTMPKKGVWDLQLTPLGQEPQTIVTGDVVIDPDVTEST